MKGGGRVGPLDPRDASGAGLPGCRAAGRGCGLWVDHDLDYNVLRGGHTRAVVALYSCSGGAGCRAAVRGAEPPRTHARPGAACTVWPELWPASPPAACLGPPPAGAII